MRALHALAVAYSQRPSAVVGISDPALAYSFDLSVLMASLEKDAVREARPPATGDVRTLARGAIPRIKIPENGIW